MKHWMDDPEHQRFFSDLCHHNTPITLVSAREPKETLDCIAWWLTGDAFCVIVDEDNHPRGFVRGEDIYGDLEDIGDVIVREK